MQYRWLSCDDLAYGFDPAVHQFSRIRDDTLDGFLRLWIPTVIFDSRTRSLHSGL